MTSSVTKLGDAYVLLLTLEDPTGRMVGTARQQFTVVSALPARIDEAVHEIRAGLGECLGGTRQAVTGHDVDAVFVEVEHSFD